MKAKEIAQFSVHATRHSEIARDTIEEMIKEYAKAKCTEILKKSNPYKIPEYWLAKIDFE